MNIGTGREISLLELIRILKVVTGENADVRHLAARPGDLARSLASVERARDLLGFNATISLEEGLRRLLGSLIPKSA